jgi:hypothetical protein
MSGSTDETTRQSAAFLSWLDTLDLAIGDANASIETLYQPSLLWAILDTMYVPLGTWVLCKVFQRQCVLDRDPDCSSEVSEARDDEDDSAENRKTSLEQLLACIFKYYK